jgi:hypothetical protein
MTSNIDQQIEDYLNHNLSESDRQNFERRISEDQELAAMVKDLQEIEEGLHAVGMDHFKNDLRQWEQELAAQNYSVGWKRYLAVAAVITLVIIPAVYLFIAKKPTSEELFLAYYEPYDEMITSRGNANDSLGILLADGIEAYNQGAYQRCSELLQSYMIERPDDHRVALYLGIAQLEIDQKELAEANFIRAQQDPGFKQQAQWYQALTYLKFEDNKKARDMLNSIITSENHYRKAQAERLLDQLQ